MINLKKTDLSRAKNLRHVFRFIDDLIPLNDNDEFMRSLKDHAPHLIGSPTLAHNEHSNTISLN